MAGDTTEMSNPGTKHVSEHASDSLRSDDSRFKASISRDVASEPACRNNGFEVRFGFWVEQQPFGLSSESICSPESM